MDPNTVVLLLVLHFIGDFLLQSDWMAKNKSKSLKALALHVSMYMIPFFYVGYVYALVNALAHMAVDAVTSRLNSHLWEKKEVHWFFVSIGFDQLIHLSTLVLTYQYLVPK